MKSAYKKEMFSNKFLLERSYLFGLGGILDYCFGSPERDIAIAIVAPKSSIALLQSMKLSDPFTRSQRRNDQVLHYFKREHVTIGKSASVQCTVRYQVDLDGNIAVESNLLASLVCTRNQHEYRIDGEC